MKLRHFQLSEFQCPCCGALGMHDTFLERLDEARLLADIPFKINSGFRCLKHNKEVGGSDTSSHLQGLAVDIAVNNSEHRYLILTALFAVNFTRIGIGVNFIHVDDDAHKSQEVIWIYS